MTRRSSVLDQIEPRPRLFVARDMRRMKVRPPVISCAGTREASRIKVRSIATCRRHGVMRWLQRSAANLLTSALDRSKIPNSNLRGAGQRVEVRSAPNEKQRRLGINRVAAARWMSYVQPLVIETSPYSDM